jgi:xanthine dehydrogenase YagS FAD-binding subunit
MKPFTYLRVIESGTAIQAATSKQTKFIAGGTNLLDLMQDGIEQPDRLVATLPTIL